MSAGWLKMATCWNRINKMRVKYKYAKSKTINWKTLKYKAEGLFFIDKILMSVMMKQDVRKLKKVLQVLWL